MLDESLKSQVQQIFSVLEAEYTFEATVDATHPSRTELIELLEETASCLPSAQKWNRHTDTFPSHTQRA